MGTIHKCLTIADNAPVVTGPDGVQAGLHELYTHTEPWDAVSVHSTMDDVIHQRYMYLGDREALEARMTVGLLSLGECQLLTDWLLATDTEYNKGHRYGHGYEMFERMQSWFTAIHFLDFKYFPACLLAAVANLHANRERNGRHSQRYLTDSWLERNCENADESPLFRLFDLLWRPTSDAALAIKVGSDLSALVADHPNVIIQALPWLIAERDRHWDDLVVAAALEHDSVLQALKTMPFASVSERSLGLALRASGEDGTSRLANLQWQVDQSLFSSPTEFSAPTALWLAGGTLEASLHSLVKKALLQLPAVASDSEVLLTGALLTAIQIRLEELNTLALTTKSRHLGVSYLAPNNLDEKQHGADLVIVVEVQGRSMQLRRAHFAQVKASLGASKSATWTINFKQLEDLLGKDQTATYWLIGPQPDRTIFVVPAAFLKARADALLRTKPGQASMSLTYAVVRNAATTVNQALVDLVIGLWLGTTAIESLAYVDGSQSRRPAHILTISIRDGE